MLVTLSSVAVRRDMVTEVSLLEGTVKDCCKRKRDLRRAIERVGRVNQRRHSSRATDFG